MLPSCPWKTPVRAALCASPARNCLEAMSSWACACAAARHESPCRLEKLVVVCACLDELRELSPTGGGSATCVDLTGRPQGSDMLSGRSWWRRGKGFCSCPCPCAARFDRAECWRAPKCRRKARLGRRNVYCRKPTHRQAECALTGVPCRRCGACQRGREALPPRTW